MHSLNNISLPFNFQFFVNLPLEKLLHSGIPLNIKNLIPRNEVLKKKWIECIGEELLNTKNKNIYVCSEHFEDRDFNRTLEVVRLHEGVVPSKFVERRLVSKKIKHNQQASSSRLNSIDTVKEKASKEISNTDQQTPLSMKTVGLLKSNDTVKEIASKEICNAVQQTPLSITTGSPRTVFVGVPNKFLQIKMTKLQEKCKKQSALIKRLHDRLRRRNLKIMALQDIIDDLLDKD